MTGASGFETLCKDVAQQFLRTAILIDDQIVTLTDQDDSVPAAPLDPPPFIMEEVEVDGPPAVSMQPTVVPHSDVNVLEGGLTRDDSGNSSVQLKPLADAFLDQRIICAVLNPSTGDPSARIVERAVNAAGFADIVIIDWFLRAGDAELTLESLIGLLGEDVRYNGRKRIIIVYSSAAPLEERRDELRQRIVDAHLPCEEVETDYPALRSGSSRIVFVEKASAGRGVPVKDLPSIALSEFAKETQGLMPIFALGAIARIRNATHHMLSVFNPGLDAALVGHRMVLAEPSDARDFALEVLLLQLKGVLTADSSLDTVLDRNAVGAWFDSQFPSNLDGALTAAGVSRDEFRAAIEDANPKAKFGAKKVKEFHQALFLPQAADAAAAKELERACELARLSTHVREAEGATPLPAGWRPHLTLGSILRTATTEEPVFLLCTQPLCDTLRLGGPVFFSFVLLETGAADSNDFSVVVRSDGQQIKLKASRKGSGRFFAKFAPDPEIKRVLSTFEAGSPPTYVFGDEAGTLYRWIADIDRLKAQRAAEEMASALSRVGMDEFEWLRMGGKIAP